MGSQPSAMGNARYRQRALLLMAHQRILHTHLKTARVSVSDLNAKLRAAGISHPDEVFAVVMETTGSVEFFSDVRGADLLVAHGNDFAD